MLILPAGTTGRSGNQHVDLGGFLQGVAIQFGSGRVYVSGEAGGLTSQSGIPGLLNNPGNARLLRNVVWWLTQ